MICGRYYLGLDHMDEIAPIRREVFGKEQGWSDDILFDETDEQVDIRADQRIGPKNMLCAVLSDHTDLTDGRTFEACNAHADLHPDQLGHFVRFHMRPHSFGTACDVDRFFRVFFDQIFIVDQSGRGDLFLIFKMISEHRVPR